MFLMSPIILIVSIISSILMTTMNPLHVVLLIIAQLLMMSFMLLLIMKSSWFSFILLMVFLSGMMVVFSYVSSLASNEKFSLNLNKIFFLTSLIYVTSMLFMWSKFYNFNSYNINMFFNKLNLIHFSIAEMSYSEMFLPTLMMMIYLLFSLIVVVKNINLMKAPLRALK